MGEVERTALLERRKGYLQNAVLSAVGIAGMLAVAMVAPNVLQLLGKYGSRKGRLGEQARSAASRLASKGHVKFVAIRGKKYLQITKAGKQVLDNAERHGHVRATALKPQRWDQRWRLVVFDIPERRKIVRNRLRRTVRSFGFLRVQDSVWIYPYDCEDLVILLKADLRLGREVLYAIVEKIENDTWIRRHFKLSA